MADRPEILREYRVSLTPVEDGETAIEHECRREALRCVGGIASIEAVSSVPNRIERFGIRERVSIC